MRKIKVIIRILKTQSEVAIMDLNVKELINCQYFSNIRILAGKEGVNRLVKRVRILESLETNLCFENG
ncbi:hypothetical protein [endosymbiont 'TC1' of Trimyema compressum]|uniref:hypothetical protein n=1 Tax=endosymbiont 'TC1' of Trimyema compressum TaxID=243899 RepID=UPI00139233C0|nr:hypothetical protein [endosymbiont 'TC1' of Trimyema compressum]